MNIDLVQLVRDGMEKIGCGSAVDDEIDPHSPICISLVSLPDMFVELDDSQVMLWSRLPYTGPNQLAPLASDILNYLLPRNLAMFVCRRSVLTLDDDGLMLHAVVHPDYLADAEKFVQALEGFFEDLFSIHEIMSQ